MHVTTTLDAPCSRADLFAAVEDLGDYPTWLSIVTRSAPDNSVGTGGGAAPTAWLVDLRGRLGPLARSKRLRMVRTVHNAPHRLRFERQEIDGRTHSQWVLEAEVTETADGSRLTMSLDYGGSFGGNLLERMLGQAIEQSRPRLLARVTGAPDPGP